MEAGKIRLNLRGRNGFKKKRHASTSWLDLLFFFEEVQNLYKKVVKFEVDDQDETTLVHLIRLDAIYNDPIDLLSQGF